MDEDEIDEEKPLKIREAADLLGLDYATVRGAIEAGHLKASPFETSFRVRPADLAEYRDRLAADARPSRPTRKTPDPAPAAESPEIEAARLFAERSRRWARRPGGGPKG